MQPLGMIDMFLELKELDFNDARNSYVFELPDFAL